MSSYIVAHIVFDNELKSVDIVNDNHNTTPDTIEDNVKNGIADFYIKILVQKCGSQSSDCFGLSNGTYYKLVFDQVFTSGTLVNGDFLKNSGAPIGTNGANGTNGTIGTIGTNGPNGTIGTNGTNAVTGANQPPSIKEFNDLIVKALTGAFGLEGFKELIVKALTGDFGLEGFKELIVKALTSNFGKSGLEDFKELIVNVLNTVP